MAPTPRRFPMVMLMGFIGVIAVGLGLMRNGSEMAANVTFNVLVVALMVALLGAIVRRGDGAWVGFALFGWAYACFALVPAIRREIEPQRLLDDDLLYEVVNRLRPGREPEPSPPTFPSGYVFKLRDVERDGLTDFSFDFPDLNQILSADELTMLKDHMDKIHSHEKRQEAWHDSTKNAMGIGHSLLALMAALTGAILGRALSNKSTPAAASPLPG